MLSFDSSIQKSADLKTQSSSSSWLERVLLTPYQHRRMNFQWPLLLNPLKKHFEDAEDVDAVPLCTFLVTISKNENEKILSDFFFLIFFLFFRFFLLFIFFSVASSVSSSSKTLWRHWQCWLHTHWHFFWGNF